MSNFTRELALIPTQQLNIALTSIGEPLCTTKNDAVTALVRAVQQGRITIDQVRACVPTQTTKVALEPAVPDEIRKKILNTQFEVAKAVESVKAVQEVANNVLDTVHKNAISNEKKITDLATRLNADIQAIQGVDYGKVENIIRSEVSALFDTFRTQSTPEELTVIANALPTSKRVKARDVFPAPLQYEVGNESIDFGDLDVDVWNDVNTPALVDDYIFNPKHLHQALIALDDPLPDNVWLAGERGTGKSEFVSQVASRLGRRLFRVNFDEAIERAEFIGGNTIVNGNVEWKAGVITQAIQHTGALVLLDEIGFARAQNLAVLHALCERSPHRSIVIAETGTRIPVASHVAFFCADNSNGHGDASGNFAGVRDQNTAFIDRFSYTLNFEYLPFADEVNLITKRTGLSHDASTVLVKFATVAREKARAGILTQPPSLRQLFAWARSIQKGVPVALAFDNAIINKFPADCESELRGVFQATIDTVALKSYLRKV
jgi:hypothetical protein